MYKNLIIAALLSFLLSSCGTIYYYAQMDTTDPYTQKNEDYKFISTGDSIDIAYSFTGKNAPLNIEIFNKMKRRAYVDWDNSYFIIGDDEANQVNLGEYVDSDDQLRPIESFDETQQELFELSNLQFDKINKKKFKSEAVEIAENTMMGLDVAHFTEEDSPLYMRGFLAIRIGSKNTKPLIYQQDFFVKKIIKSSDISPYQMMMTRLNWNDYFYTEEEYGKGARKVLTTSGLVLATVALVAVAVAADVDLGDEADD